MIHPGVKRKVRLVVALSVAVVLAVALLYTSFTASSKARQPSDLLAGGASGRYDLTGKVVTESLRREGAQLRFDIADPDDRSASIPVRYSGSVPDPFREGREIILTGTVENGIFVAEKDSMLTKDLHNYSADG